MKYLFEMRIKPGYSVEDYAAEWVRVSRIIQSMPGARGTRLHRKIDEPDTLLAIAEWESKEARDSAMEELERRDSESQGQLALHRDYGEFSLIGEIDDAEWVVLPGDEGVGGGSGVPD